MPTFVHTADIHLDTVFSARFSPDQAELRRKEVMMTFQSIAERASTADLFFISGDLFDSRFVSTETKSFLKRCFRDMPDTRVLIAAGNHDPLTEDSAYLTEDWGSNVHIFSPKMEYVDFPELKTRVYGKSFSHIREKETLMENFAPAEDWCNILVIHGEVVADGGESEYNPIEKSMLEKSGMIYAALGHIHKYSGIQSIGGTYYAYPGIPEGRGFDEDGEKGFIVGCAEVDRVTAQWIPASRRKFVHLQVDVSESEDGLQVLSKVRNAIIESGGAHNIYKAELVGKVNQEFVKSEILHKQLSSDVFYLELINHTKALYDVEKIAKESGLRGDFVSAMLERISTMSEDEKDTGYLALQIGIEAMEGGRMK